MQIPSEFLNLSTKLILDERFHDLSHWQQVDSHGKWLATADGLVGEWLEASPSLFLKQPISGDFILSVQAARMRPGDAFMQRFKSSKHSQTAKPESLYNFNFWLRAEAPDGGDFIAEYPGKLGSGWNGMGDDHWQSYFTTVVRNETENWVRLRRSPGYEKFTEARDKIPLLPYDEAHDYTFVLHRGRIVSSSIKPKYSTRMIPNRTRAGSSGYVSGIA